MYVTTENVENNSQIEVQRTKSWWANEEILTDALLSAVFLGAVDYAFRTRSLFKLQMHLYVAAQTTTMHCIEVCPQKHAQSAILWL